MSGAVQHWVSMPEFTQEKQEPYHKLLITFSTSDVTIICRFESSADLHDFSVRVGAVVTPQTKTLVMPSFLTLERMIGQPITRKTKSIWHPQITRGLNANKRWVSAVVPEYRNRYPIFIVSKNRAHNGLTWRALDLMGGDYRVIVEEHQFAEYAEAVGAHRLLILPQRYLDQYDTCDDKGGELSRGPGAARNFALDLSKALGYKRHWVLDDNLDDFHRLHENLKTPVRTMVTFRACEDFVDRYSNIPVAGMNYYSFCKTTDKVPPLVWNTRIYSCLLIDNDAGYRWRGRYNEDTDLSLRVLKDGLCTVQFNAFLCGKVTTQRMRGGNSAEFYDHEGTLPKSQMLKDLHPDVSEVVWKFNRWHHHVDYSSFKVNQPVFTAEPDPSYYVEDYGLEMTELESSDKRRA